LFDKIDGYFAQAHWGKNQFCQANVRRKSVEQPRVSRYNPLIGDGQNAKQQNMKILSYCLNISKALVNKIL